MGIVTFKNGSIDMAGTIHLPNDFDEKARYAALVCVHPGSSVKEQTAGLYAERMAERGFVALAFDASTQGESGGEPRSSEDPSARVEDIRCAVDFLTTLGYVDDERIGILGVCAGGGYAVNAAMTEHRIKAVGTVVAVNIGRARRQAGGAIEALEAIGKQRTAEARGEKPRFTQWLPNTPKEREDAGLTGLDLSEAVDYYRTPRGQHERSNNELRIVSTAPQYAFDAFHLVDELLNQPLQIIVGSKVGEFGSYKDGQDLFARATCKKDLFVVEGASHYDLYDQPGYVDQAAAKLESFYRDNLQG